MITIRKILLCMVLLLPVAAAWADSVPKVVQVSPAGWSGAAATGSVMEAQLDAPLAGSTNFVLLSSWRGARAGAVTGDGMHNTFTPAAPLLPGESFESVLSGTGGTAFSWRFQVAPQGGGASYATSSISTLIDMASVARFRNIALADVNGDNSIDVVAPAWGSNKVYFASQAPAFSSNMVLGRAIQDVAVGDFNSDGLPDLVLGCATQAFSVALNSAGGYVAGSVQTVGGVTGPLRSVAVGDLDGNGKPDAVTVSETSGHVIPLLNDGSGALTAGAPIAGGAALYALDVGDLDRDGIADVVAVGPAGRLVTLKGKGDGTFEAPAAQTVSDQTLYACRIADFNLDGYADIAAVGAGGVVVVGTGSSSNIVFAQVDHGLTLSTLYGLAVADCDANGYPDIGVCGGTSVAVLLGVNGGFRAKEPTIELSGELLRDVEIGDLNQDGCLDLVVCGLSSGKTYVLWNAPAPVPLIKGNGLDLLSGEAASLEKGTDFGVVPVYATRTNQFQLINRGKGTLLLSGAALTGVSTSIMNVLNMPATVSPGATQVFSVVYAPQSTGTVAAVLTITNNSLATVSNAASPYVIKLAGQSVRSSPRVLSIEGTNAVYDGTAKPVVVTVDPVSTYTVSYNGQSEAPATAGVYTVVAEVNVELCYGTVTSVLTIAKRPLTVTCPDATRAYGETNPVVSVTLTNFVAGEGLTNLISAPVAGCAATSNSPVGTYPISGTNGLAENYSFVNVSGTLTVTQTLLTVKADNKTRLMGEADPVFTATFTGWKNGEGTNVFTTQPVGTTTATLASPSGTYPITFSGGAATNYSFSYLGATLTVYGVTAQVSITNTDFTYDGTPKSVTVTTFPTNLDVQVTYNGAETAPVTAGVYTVFALILGSDYSGSTNGTLTIRKAPQTVTNFLPANGTYPADLLLTLSASGSPSGIPVAFSVAAGPACMASTNQLRFLGLGEVTVAAWQAEGDNWLASPALTNQYSSLETNAVHFAAQAGQTPLWPYASWETAASNVQVAVDVASSGEIVRVGAGMYATGGRAAPGAALASRLVIDKAIQVLAESGPSATFLAGQPGTGAGAPLGADAVRCVVMTNGGLLAGFTLTNGFTAGESAAAFDQAGGGALLSSGSLLSNCVVVGCGAVSGGGFHGGAATRCVLSGNQALAEGGGAGEAVLSASLLWNNAAPYGGGAFQCELNACTLADNTALFGGGTYEGTLVNGIVWYNTGYDCFGTVASRVNAGSGVTAGLDGCLAAPPLFVNRAGGNYRLAYGSPCINAGTNSASPAGALDLDGAVRPIHASVDMGAYEFFGTPGVPLLSALSGIRAHQVDVAWLASTDSVRVIGFRIAVSNQADAAGAVETVVPAPALSGVVTGLAPNTVYSCRIRQENDYDVGGWSGWQCFTSLTEAAIITVTSRTFNVTYAAGHSFTQSVALANAGATPCVWSGSVSYEGTAKDWLSVAPAAGTVGAFDSTGVNFVVNAAGLGVGTYTAQHTLSSPNATNSPIVQVVTLTVTRAVDTITFGATNQVYSGTSRVVTATAGSGEAVAVTYNGSSTPPVDAGVYAVSGVVDTVDWTGSSSTWLTVSQAPQAITAFLPASGDVPSTNTMSLSANGGGSGNTLVFSIVAGPASLLPGNQVRFSDYGEVRVSVAQAGNSNWLPAPTVTNVYRVVPVAALLHHVARAGQAPVWPYASWDSAASNIQDAVDAAWDGDAVAVTSGVYQAGGRVAPGGAITNRICVTRAIELYGVKGAASTVVVGAPGTDSGLDAVRGLYAGTNAVIRGFTFAGGRTASTGGQAQDRSGGGVYLAGGAELRHCIVSNNSSATYGGGAFVQQTGRVNNCLLTGNTSARGGGLCLYAGGEALHCTIASNVATTAAGGAYLPNGGTIGHGIVWGNLAPAGSPQNLQSMSGSIVYTCAGDGVTDGVAGCLVADPMFAPDGFMLESDSPCVNVGDNAQAATTTDLKGDPRIVSILDLGAYEYVVTAAAPKGLEISELTGSSVKLHWRPGDIMPVTLYNVEVETLEGSNVLSAQFAGTTTSTVAVGLSDSMPYRWRAQASNSQGVSMWTSWKSFTTRGIILTVTPAACNVGGGLEILVEGRGLSLTSDIHAVSLAGVPASILDQGTNWVRVLAPATTTPGTGDVAVSSVSGGDLLLSNAFVFLPSSAPVLLRPSSLSETSLVARWESLPGAISYRFQASAVPDFSSFLPGYEGTNALVDLTALDVFPLVPGTNYLRMQAWFAEGFGPFSSTLTVKRRLQSLTITGTNAVYDGVGKSVSVAVEPAALAASITVRYNGSATLPFTAGVYAVAAEVDTDSYFGDNTGVLTIAKRDLVATGDAASRAYGEPNPALTYTWSNFAAGEGATNLAERPVATCSATNHSPAGDYSIEVSGGSGANYRVVCSNGTLTVTQAVLTVTADDATWLYGKTNSPFTLTITGWKNGEGTNALAALPVAASVATPLSTSGTYPITVSGGSALNYAFNYMSGTLTLNPIEAVVTISGTNLVYDGNAKSVTATTDPTNLVVVLTYNDLETQPVTAGVYAVHAEIDEKNYCGSTNATLTIRKADQNVASFRPASGAYPADQLLALSADGSPSGIPVTFTVLSGPGVLESDHELRFQGFGSVKVAARQVAGDNWNASPSVTNTYEAVDTNTVYFVAKAGQTPRWPYVSPETAASNIQTAVDQASSGETVWVGPGLYAEGGRPAAGAALTNRLVLDKAVSVLSVAGPAATVISGRPGTGAEAPLGADAIRCVAMTDGALLAGFTLTNGFTAGALAGLSEQAGGGAYLASSAMISNCVITGCGAISGGGLQGGIALRCRLTGNAAINEGGGAANARLSTCLLWNNAAPYGGGAFRCNLDSCTLADNAALYGGGTYEGGFANGIAWYNTGWDCFGTLVGYVNGGSGIAAGVNGCLSAAPLFVNRAQGDYRLAYGSPCINAGTNGVSPACALDLDGAVRPIHATIDLGAYEFFGTPGLTLLSAPSDIRAHQAAVSWQAPTDSVRVIAFRIAVSNLAAAAPATETVVQAPALSGVVTGLAPNTAYSCRVRAENDYDVGAWSGWQSFTTLTEAVILAAPALTFNATYAAGHSLTQSVTLANPGASPCVWSGAVSYPGASSGWLTVAPGSGTVAASGSTGLSFVVSVRGLDAGTHTAWHTLSSPNATNSPQVQVVTLHVARAADTITFGDTNQVYSGTARPVTATSFSGEPVTVTYNGLADAPVGAGAYTVTGVVDTLNWTAVATTRLTIARAPQAITGFLPASGDVSSTNILTLSANGGGSGKPLVFAIVSGPASLLPGNRVRLSGYGDVRVAVGQAGNANWLPAATVTNLYRVIPVSGLTHYVAQAGQAPLWPYAAWNDAASNIQDAVDVAWDGDFVTVSNGDYRVGGRPAPGGTITNRVCITRAITLASVNGPAVTRVLGAEPVTGSGFDAVRGLYAATNAVVRGFTFTGGHSAFVSDLSQDRSGGGVYLTGGAELSQSIVTGNRSAEYGGGVFVRESGLVNNCLMTGNQSDQGAGLCLFAGGEAVLCTMASNTAATAAGGVYIPDAGSLVNCIVWGNRAPPAARQDLLSRGGTVSFTCAGDGVTDGAAGCRLADPLFTAGGYRPAAASPCVNAGNGARVLTETDLKGDPRVVVTVDMGAYEYLAAPAAPTNLAVLDRTLDTATLSWQQGDVMPVTGYDVEMETLGTTNVVSWNVPGTEESLAVDGFARGTGYRWRARAMNSQGASGWTAWQLFFTPGFIVSVDPVSCNIGGGVDVLIEGQGLGYASNIVSVSLCGVPAAIVDQAEDWVRVTAPMALVPGVGDIRVSSPTGGDSVLSNAFTFLEAAAPVLLAPTEITASSLTARWKALAGAESFQLQVSARPDFATVLPGLEGTNAPSWARQMAVQGLAAGTNYMRLRAWFTNGYGPFCAPFAIPSGPETPWVRNLMGDSQATAGQTRTYDLSTVFAGTGLVLSASCDQPGMATPLVDGTTLTLTAGPGEGLVRIIVTATQADSGYGVSTSFRLDVAPAPLAPLRVNCGGKKSGLWLHDQGFSGGVVFRTNAVIQNTSKAFPPEVFQSCRSASNLTYSFPDLPNGTYIVRLAFAELVQDRIGARVFKVKIEGKTVLPRLDVFAAAGNRFSAYQALFKVAVSDGNGLQIKGLGLNGSEAFFNGISIMSAPPAGMLVVPAGVNEGTDPDSGAYSVTNRGKLYVDVMEVTKQQWDEVRAWGLAHGYADLAEGAGKAADHPVQGVSWYDCVKWCNARSQMQGLPPAYYTTPSKEGVYTNGQLDLTAECVDVWAGYRLPTGSEWEYAARGGATSLRFPWGNEATHSNANYFSDAGFAYDVSATRGFHPDANDGTEPYTLPATAFGGFGFKGGLYNMAGNVAEWCWDRDSAGTNRLVRGGAWSSDASWSRISQSLMADPVLSSDDVGFRAVLPRP